MIPIDWIPHYRASDGELAGYLEGADPAVVPRTLFGYPLAEAIAMADAVMVLEQRGLSCLSERWDLRLENGELVPVLIMSAYADTVVVVETEYGYFGPDSPRHTLTAPTGDRLVLA